MSDTKKFEYELLNNKVFENMKTEKFSLYDENHYPTKLGKQKKIAKARRCFSRVMFLQDSDITGDLAPNAEDTRKGLPRNQLKCELSNCGVRTLDIDGMFTTKSVAYIAKGDTLYRFMLTAKARKSVAAQDRKGKGKGLGKRVTLRAPDIRHQLNGLRSNSIPKEINLGSRGPREKGIRHRIDPRLREE